MAERPSQFGRGCKVRCHHLKCKATARELEGQDGTVRALTVLRESRSSSGEHKQEGGAPWMGGPPHSLPATAAGSGGADSRSGRRSINGSQSASSGRPKAATRMAPAQNGAVKETSSARPPGSGAQGMRTKERARLVSETTVARCSLETRRFT